jgi:hypothetical protein
VAWRFGQFLVRVICDCGACREIEPEALARLVGLERNAEGPRATDALLEVREEEGVGGHRRRKAQAASSAEKPALVQALVFVPIWI